MSLRKKLTGAGLSLGLIFALSAVAFAQQQQPANNQQDNGRQQQQEQGRWRRGERQGMGKRGHGGGILRLMNQLNLTDAQKQQLRAIEERFESSTKAQREEMRRLHQSTEGGEPSADTKARFQALRAEIDQAMRGQRQEMLNVLTQEQRTQFEQLVKERKARHEERRGGGRGMNQQNDDDN